MRASTERGFCVGGWFVFGKTDRWAYRSNEFSCHDHAWCLDTVKRQAEALREIIACLLPGADYVQSCSLEKVHAIWKF